MYCQDTLPDPGDQLCQFLYASEEDFLNQYFYIGFKTKQNNFTSPSLYDASQVTPQTR